MLPFTWPPAGGAILQQKDRTESPLPQDRKVPLPYLFSVCVPFKQYRDDTGTKRCIVYYLNHFQKLTTNSELLPEPRLKHLVKV